MAALALGDEHPPLGDHVQEDHDISSSSLPSRTIVIAAN
jgi:hypothetical protein